VRLGQRRPIDRVRADLDRTGSEIDPDEAQPPRSFDAVTRRPP
jgi:hypothetical protein